MSRLSRLIRWCVTLVTLVLAIPAFAQATHIQPRLIAESSRPAAGSTVTIAIDMKTEPGWHGYWSNPGEAGLPPKLTWTLPKGATLSDPRFPVPQTLIVADLVNYVFKGDHALLFDLKLPAGLAAGTRVMLDLKAVWLACTDEICVPENGHFTLPLTIGDGARDNAGQFDTWRSKLPMPLGGTATFARGGNGLRLAIPFPARAAVGDPHFFPAQGGLLTDAAPQAFSRSGDMLILDVAAPARAGGPVAGVLALGTGTGLSITAQPGLVPSGGTPLHANTTASGWAAIVLALGGAVLGGLILNVMPCVFPIVSLKALSLARAGGDPAAAKREALAYAAGIILVCVIMGALILGLRAAGTQVGWAFQLQNPAIVFVLLLLAVAITLNLAGAFELGGFGGGQALVDKGGIQGAFWTGVLAAFVATPCTGPFMAAALGAALVLPAPAALTVFAGLGLGLALPFVAIAWIPALRTRLPKPGAWMQTFQRILAVPMALTVIGLLWLIDRQSGAQAFQIAVIGVVVVSAVIIGAGRRERLPRTAIGVLAAILIGGVVLIKGQGLIFAPSPALAATPFSEARLAEARKTGPVFLYFTADWCLTCKVNEKTAIETDAVRTAFAKGGVTVMTGDWTNGDPVITRFLYAQGVSGVPLYLYYPKGSSAPTQLPQVLTPGTLTALTP